MPPSREYFDNVLDALIGFLPRELRGQNSKSTSRNLKVWYGQSDREHYEVQAIGGRGRPRLEVGWHAEHRDRAANDGALQGLLAAEKSWRKKLGVDAEAGRFIGDAGRIWRRISEVWEGPNLWGPEAAVEAAARLADYVEALEPARRSR